MTSTTLGPSPASQAAIQRITDAIKASRGEHWITFLVTGPGVCEQVTLKLRSPEVRLLDEGNVPYLHCQLRAIRRVKALHRMECWQLKRFDAHARDWSDSVDKFNEG